MPNGNQCVYVIDEPTRQALLMILSKAIHPSVSFEQVSRILAHLDTMTPVPVEQPHPHGMPDNDGCGGHIHQDPDEDDQDG
jgi:hypothetical protein